MKLTGAFLLLTLASLTTAGGPKGEFTTFLSDLKYKPGRACYRPLRPYSGDKYETEQYFRDAQRYMDCTKADATSDMDYAAEVVADGYKEEADNFMTEVRSVN